MACNTGSVHALDAMRAEFEPDIPVIGTVPAIQPAASAYHQVAIWATVATTASAYQRRLIAEFGGSAEVTAVACPGLADAVDAGDQEAAAAAIAAAAAQTPPGCQAVVLGCTEYELAARQIGEAVPGAVTFGSAVAVAAQALRRLPALDPAPAGVGAGTPGTGNPGTGNLSTGNLSAGSPGTVRVLLSGRPSGPAAGSAAVPGGPLARAPGPDG